MSTAALSFSLLCLFLEGAVRVSTSPTPFESGDTITATISNISSYKSGPFQPAFHTKNSQDQCHIDIDCHNNTIDRTCCGGQCVKQDSVCCDITANCTRGTMEGGYMCCSSVCTDVTNDLCPCDACSSDSDCAGNIMEHYCLFGDCKTYFSKILVICLIAGASLLALACLRECCFRYRFHRMSPEERILRVPILSQSSVQFVPEQPPPPYGANCTLSQSVN